MRAGFSPCHPAVNFLYFALVIGFSMVLTHPACLMISLCGAAACLIAQRGWRGAAGTLWYVLPVVLLATVVNPAFSHRGATVLAYLPSGNPLTLESIAYGVGAGVMLAAVLLWFSCFSQVMTTDQLVYLFGRIIPALALVLSMTLRFVPRFTRQLRKVSQAQQSLGQDGEENGRWGKVRRAVTALSVVVTWALENAVDTADSMRARGYGLPGRTAFSIYRMERRDVWALLWLVLCGLTLLIGSVLGGLSWRYYPTLQGGGTPALTAILLLTELALCLLPAILHWKEERTWRRSRSAN